MRMPFALLAVSLLAAVWLLPLDASVGGPFAAHMLRHMALVTVAAPLIVLAVPAASAVLAIPPLAGAVIEFVVVWAWHVPALHQAAARDPLLFLLEQGMFLIAGIAVWAGALAATRPLAGAGGLFVTSMHMTLLGALLILSGEAHYGGGLADQRVGGMIMVGLGTPAYLVGGLWLTARTLRGGEDRFA